MRIVERRHFEPVARQQLGRTAVSQNMRNFASAFPVLEEARHLADCDPSAVFLQSDSTDLVDAAANGVSAFDQVAADEKADVLALMLANVRV